MKKVRLHEVHRTAHVRIDLIERLLGDTKSFSVGVDTNDTHYTIKCFPTLETARNYFDSQVTKYRR